MAKFRLTNLTVSFANVGIIGCAALSLLFFPGLGLARDLDGKYANAPLKQWFDSLASRRGPCCSVADGQSVEDVDWDTKDGKYRVRPMDRGAARRAGNCAKQVRTSRGMALQGL